MKQSQRISAAVTLIALVVTLLVGEISLGDDQLTKTDVFLSGPGVSIQLERGGHRWRLVIPCYDSE